MTNEVPVDLILRYHASWHVPGWDGLNERGKQQVWDTMGTAVLDLYELSKIADSDRRLQDDSFWVLVALDGVSLGHEVTTLGKLARRIKYLKKNLIADLLDLRAHGYFPYIEEADPDLHDFIVRELDKEEVS